MENENRLQGGEAWMYCSDCMCKLYSFDGNMDQSGPCPTKQKCEEERSQYEQDRRG